MALDRKVDALASLGADLLVLPEAAEQPLAAVGPDASYAWRGRTPRKGLGVLATGGWRVAPIEAETHPWELPVRVLDPSGREAFSLLAIWTVQAPGRGAYTAQLAATIDRWGKRLDAGRWLLAGDLNASAPDPRHIANVEALHALGMRSAYHEARGVGHGLEPDPTLRWTARGGERRAYHCDVVFLSRSLLPGLRDVTIGTFGDWVESGLSDHCPVTVTLQA